MSSQAQVRELFSLPKKEIIFDDFGCSYSKAILYQGRMYLTENYICFYSSIMGITKKIIIPLNDVTKITKAKRLGVKSIKIQNLGKKECYQFQSFTDSDKTFKIISKLWVNVSPNASQIIETSEEDETEESQGGSKSQATEKLQAKDTTQIKEKSKKEFNSEVGHHDYQKQKSMIVPDFNGRSLSFKQVSPTQQHKASEIANDAEELKKEDDLELIISADASAKPRVGSAKEASTNPDLISKDPLIQNNQIGEGQIQEKSSSVQYEKAQGLNEIVSKDKPKENSADFISKEELEKLLDAYPLCENHEDLEKFCLCMSTQDFFANVLTISGPNTVNTIEKFYIEKGEQKLSFQEWKVPDPAEEYDGKPVLQASQLFAEFQVKDNPFVKISPTTKYLKIIENSETKLQMKVLSKCTNVPYCDTFAIEEDWLVLSPQPGAQCCVVRVTMQLIFYKSTIFRSKIQGSAFKGARQYYGEFSEWFKKRNLFFKEKKQQGVGKLKHGIEKSSKLFEKAKQEDKTQILQPQTLLIKASNFKAAVVVQLDKFRIEILLGIVILFLLNVYLKQCAMEAHMILLQEQLMKSNQL